MSECKTNTDFIVELMEYSPTGAIAQAFILEAVSRYAKTVAAADPAKLDTGIISGEAWVATAEHIAIAASARRAFHPVNKTKARRTN